MAASDSLRYANNRNNNNNMKIANFYVNCNIFITGSTGFVGKTLLEKLLRSCDGIDKIFVLMRAKRSMNIQERLEQLLQSCVFNKIRAYNAKLFDKIVPIEGDITLPNLGLNVNDLNLLKEMVHVVFHSAATVRFDELLKVSLTINTLGTRNVLDLTTTIKHLKCYVHVSTAYSNSHLNDIKEIIYKPNFDPNDLINSLNILSNDAVEAMAKYIMMDHPNSYTFTKSLAEHLVNEYSNRIPCAIVRPSIVCATWKDPIPGWVDNIAGITGVMMQVSRGTIKSIVYGDDLISDIIPVDIVVNTLITSAWYVATFKNGVKVYNCTSGNLNKITWKEVGDLTQKYARIYPSKYTLFYPGFSTRTSWFTHWFYSVIFHKFPAYIYDVFLYVSHKKPIMTKICNKFESIAKVGGYFRLNEWNFNTSEFETLMYKIKLANDCDLFDIDIRKENGLNWYKYFEEYTIGIRKYVMNDDMTTLRKARNKLKMLYYLQNIFNLMAIICLIRYVLKLISNRRNRSHLKCC